MARVISIHEYELKSGVDERTFQEAIRTAERRGLFRLPGLEAYYFVKGLRGVRSGRYAAVWIYESREAWEALWGAAARPKRKEQYPPAWQVWEDEILAPLLAWAPDEIVFTAYEEI